MNTKSDQSKTPESDAASYEATTRTVGKWIVPLAKARKMECERDEARAEVERWKKNLLPFLACHAAVQGRNRYGEGGMNYMHYDLLAEAGARMVSFKRCGAPPENPINQNEH